VLTVLQHLYLVASHVEAKAARWLLDTTQGRRPMPRDSQLDAMREVLTTAVRQKDGLASGIIDAFGRSHPS